MKVSFSLRERSALFQLLTENTTDIILKTDRDGFILHASPSIAGLGFAPGAMLIGPNLLDLVHPSWTPAVKVAHEEAIAGARARHWTEFVALTADGDHHWCEIQLSRLTDDHDCAYGTLAIIRSIEERRGYEQQLFAAIMTDPLTGLTNRKAFITMLQHLVDRGTGGCLAIFAIDHFKAINLRFGQSAGDEALVIFADRLRTMMRAQDIISRIGSESLAVLLPRATPDQAAAIGRRVVHTLAERRRMAGANSAAMTASAGLAAIGETLDDTIKRAELALFFAKAQGRNRLEIDKGSQALRLPRV